MKKVFFLVAMLTCLVGCGKAQNVEYNTQEDNHIEEIIESKNVLYANKHYVSLDTKEKGEKFRSPLADMTQTEIQANQKINTKVNNKENDIINPHWNLTTKQEIIETQYITWSFDEYSVVYDNLIETTDETCRILEEISGIPFKNKKTIEAKKDFIGGFGDKNGIEIKRRYNYIEIIHELAHVLNLQTTNNRMTNSFYQEGYADYMTYKFAEYVKENNIELYNILDVASYENNSIEKESYEASIYKIYDKDIDYWLKCSDMAERKDNWPAYFYGRIFMLYLDEVYGDTNGWIKLSENCSFEMLNEIEGNKEIMKKVYGEDVFDNFYPWVKENEKYINEFFYE